MAFGSEIIRLEKLNIIESALTETLEVSDLEFVQYQSPRELLKLAYGDIGAVPLISDRFEAMNFPPPKELVGVELPLDVSMDSDCL